MTVSNLQRQHGQSMVEMVAIAGVATMLFLGILYLGRFHDIQASAIQAARYAVWERTVHSPAQMSDAQLESQTRARLFTYNDKAYKATDSKANGASWGVQSANWYDHGGSERLVKAPDSVKISTAAHGLPGKAATAIEETIGVVSKVGELIGGGEKLPQGGLYTSSVTVAVNNLTNMPAPLNALNLQLTEKGALLTDSWDANGPQQAAERSRTFTPAGQLGKVDKLLAPLKEVIALLEPALEDFHPGQICPDIVPADRLQGNKVIPVYQGAQPCY